MSKIIWIKVKETVSRNIGIEVGDEISQDEANDLINKLEFEEKIDWENPLYHKIQGLLGRDSISDIEGYHDIQVYLSDE